MNVKTPRSKQDVPLIARVIAITFGVVLILDCAFIFLVVRPLNFKLAGLGIGAGGLGSDLLYGAVLAKWPAWALFWLVP